jgi:MSHA pilin protein MshD
MSTAAARRLPGQRGVTLIELIIFILVVSIGIAGILLVMSYTTSRSADPMVVTQAKFVAEAHLEEILSKAFVDPTVNSVCPAAPVNRSNFDNICDYNAYASTGVRDQLNNPIAGLELYNVAVTVATAGVTLNNINNTGGLRVLRVDVRVTGPGAIALMMSGYRTNFSYNCPATGVGCTLR